jgi:hypothetical protein
MSETVAAMRDVTHRVRLRVARTDGEGLQLPRMPARDLPSMRGRVVAEARPYRGRDGFRAP